MEYRRIIILVMDSLGVGYDEEAYKYGDEGASTFYHIDQYVNGLNIPNLASLGIADLVELKNYKLINHPHSFTMKLNERSRGKDTLTGHWEMMGVYTTKPFKTFTDTGFPKELIDELEKRTGYKCIGNKAASGTEIIKELGMEQLKDKSLIVYTSSDSVLQIAMHEELFGLEEIYRVCEIARDICMKDEWKVARIIARPYLGDNPTNFKRTSNRHDYALAPEVDTVMDYLKESAIHTDCLGKINDIFATKGVSSTLKTTSNSDGMAKTLDYVKHSDHQGILFVNLVEFDSEYGHRRDPLGYAKAIETFDKELKDILDNLKDDDLLMITADHGNDPTWTGTDHTREKVPLLIYSKQIIHGKMLEERDSFGDIGATLLKNFNISKEDYLLGDIITEVF